MSETSEIRPEFEAAIATARHALEEFNKEPLVQSKRGGPRLSPWWRVYVQASEVAQRWHRQLREEPEPSVDDVIDRFSGRAVSREGVDTPWRAVGPPGSGRVVTAARLACSPALAWPGSA